MMRKELLMIFVIGAISFNCGQQSDSIDIASGTEEEMGSTKKEPVAPKEPTKIGTASDLSEDENTLPLQAVFVQPAVPGPMSIEIVDGNLEIEKAAVEVGAFRIGGRVFPLDWNIAARNLADASVKSRLEIKSDSLYFDGKQINLPNKAKIRALWEAVEWKGWVICLGRTSVTDKEADMRPPFLSNELITFKVVGQEAQVQTLAPQPPSEGAGIIILNEEIKL